MPAIGRRVRQGRPAPQLRYVSVSSREQPAGSALPAGTALTAPLFGSRLLFPRRFDSAFARLTERGDAAGVPIHHAFWYFGTALRLRIDPARLQWRLSDYVRDARGVRWIGASFLDAARWRGALAQLQQSPIHREMFELIAADLDFRQTRTYRLWRPRAELGRPLWRNGVELDSPERVEAYFRYCAELIASVRERGVVARSDLKGTFVSRFRHARARPHFTDMAERDIGVAIDPGGMLVRHLGGKHRMAIAQALELSRIPVEVRMVHVRWLAEQVKRTGLPPHLALPAGLASLDEGETRAAEQDADPRVIARND